MSDVKGCQIIMRIDVPFRDIAKLLTGSVKDADEIRRLWNRGQLEIDPEHFRQLIRKADTVDVEVGNGWLQ